MLCREHIRRKHSHEKNDEGDDGGESRRRHEQTDAACDLAHAGDVDEGERVEEARTAQVRRDHLRHDARGLRAKVIDAHADEDRGERDRDDELGCLHPLIQAARRNAAGRPASLH